VISKISDKKISQLPHLFFCEWCSTYELAHF
jgi:hypothetical protein